MFAETPTPAPVAVIPLVGNEHSDELLWLGAVLARQLGMHLAGAEMPVLDYNVTVSQLLGSKHSFPLDRNGAQAIREALKASALVHGRYTLDEAGKMLGFRLVVDAPDIAPVPLELSAPLVEFSRFIDRVTLAVIDQLGTPIDDELRQRVSRLMRPTSFEVLRQLARAYAAWARNQNELALAAVTSALALDANYEEAAALEVAVARTAGDTATARTAYKRWASIAEKHGRPLEAAERMTMLGHWLMERGEWEDARKAYDETRGILTRQKSEIEDAKAINNLANIELLRGKYQNAIQAYRRNLRVFEAEPDTEMELARTLYNLSLAHKNLGQREEAENAVEEALTEARRLKDTALEARSFAQRAALHDDAGRWAQANADLVQAGRLFDVIGDERGLAMVKTHQAIILKQQGDFNRSEALMQQALGLLEKNRDRHEQAVIWVNLADLYLSMGNYDSSWDYAERALKALSEMKSGWKDRAQAILDTLDSLPEEAPEPDEEIAEPEPPNPEDSNLNVSQTVTLFPRPLRPAGSPAPFGGPSPFGGDTPPTPDDDDESDED